LLLLLLLPPLQLLLLLLQLHERLDQQSTAAAPVSIAPSTSS
jgi:hypothetical protein